MIILTRTCSRHKLYPVFCKILSGNNLHNSFLSTFAFSNDFRVIPHKAPIFKQKKSPSPELQASKNSDLVVRDQGFEPWTP